MTDLEKRKMLAEFNGWTRIVLAASGKNLIGTPPGQVGFYVAIIPNYEECPAAACSLLPKIATALSPGTGRHADFWRNLGEALAAGEAAAVCDLIFEAVKKIQESR